MIVDFAPRLGEDHLPAAVVVELEDRAGIRVLLPVERDVDLRAGGTGGGGGQRRTWASGRPLEGAGGCAACEASVSRAPPTMGIGTWKIRSSGRVLLLATTSAGTSTATLMRLVGVTKRSMTLERPWLGLGFR